MGLDELKLKLWEYFTTVLGEADLRTAREITTPMVPFPEFLKTFQPLASKVRPKNLKSNIWTNGPEFISCHYMPSMSSAIWKGRAESLGLSTFKALMIWISRTPPPRVAKCLSRWKVIYSPQQKRFFLRSCIALSISLTSSKDLKNNYHAHLSRKYVPSNISFP